MATCLVTAKMIEILKVNIYFISKFYTVNVYFIVRGWGSIRKRNNVAFYQVKGV